MKDLTIEQKAQRYDEAIERANEIVNDQNASSVWKGWLCNCFPELKESEDERIKEEIKVILANTDLSRFALDYTFADMVSWLEKQGEQKSIDDLTQQEVMDIAVAKCFNEQKFDDKVEPKTAWSEEDENIRQWIISDIEKLFVLNKKSSFIVNKEIDWLKSLRLQKQWKPSEEQMKALHDLNLTGGISYAGQGQELINLYNDLKKL